MRDDGPNQKVEAVYCLVGKAVKEARIATIEGQRIIDGTIAPFYDAKTKGGQY